MITVENLSKSFGPRTLWEGLDLTVEAGRMLALVGASGSGKTTLLNCLGLLERPSGGRILFEGTDVTRVGPGRRRRFRRVNRADEAALERVGLADRAQERVHRLSGGEQQRVALARLLVKQPSLVLADEPTGALDVDNGAMVVDVLRELSREGRAVVIATHNARVRDACDAAFDVSVRRTLERS